MLIFHHFKAAFRALGVPIGFSKLKIGYIRIFVKNFQVCVVVKKGHKIERIDFLPFFLFFDRDFETLAIEVSEIRFHIQILRL